MTLTNAQARIAERRIGKLDLEHSMTVDLSGELIKDEEAEMRKFMAL